MVRRFLTGLLAIYCIIYSTSADIDYEINPNVNCTEDGFLPHPDDCKAFYLCSRRRSAIVLECQDNEIFDIETQSCKYPWQSTRIECGGTYQRSNEVVIDEEEDTPVFRTLEQNECIEEGYMHDEKNCTKFYRCVHIGSGKFLKYEYSCGPNTVWDPAINSCNHAWATKRTDCGRVDENIVDNESYPDMNQSGSDNEGQYSNNPKNPEEISSSSQASIHENYPNYPNSEATQGSYAEQSTQPSNNNNHNEQISNNHYGQQPPEADRDDKNTVQGDSSNECKEDGFMGDSQDCKKFYRCVGSGRGVFMKYEFSCGQGTVWDPESKSCNHPWATRNENCRGYFTSENNIPNKSPDGDPDNPDYPTPISSTQGPEGYPQPDNQQNLFTSPEKPKEEISTNTPINVDSSNQNQVECSKEEYVPDPNNCTKFHRCVSNGKSFKSYELTCDKGFVWDTDLQACNHPAQTRNACGTGTQIEQSTEYGIKSTAGTLFTSKPLEGSEPSTSISSTSTETNVQSSTESAIDTTSISNEISQSNTSPALDECTRDGFIGDSRNCKIFYRCVSDEKRGFKRYDFTCGEGTIWDTEQQTCNYPHLTRRECGNGNLTNTELEESNKNESSTESATSSISQSTTISSSTPLNNDQSTIKSTESSITTTSTQVFTSNPIEVNQPTSSEQPTSSTTNNIENINTNNEQSSMESVTISSSSNETSQQLNENNKPALDECTRDGFIGDSKNCTRFYRCVSNEKRGFNRYEFTCGEGTIWDTEQETCNYPHATRRECNSGDVPTNIIKPEEGRENENVTTSSSTEISTTESNVSQSTEAPNLTEISNNLEPSTTDNSNSQQVSSTSTPVESTEENTTNEEKENLVMENSSTESSSPTTQSGEDVLKQDDKCNMEGFIGDSKNCKKFYRCVNSGNGFIKYEFTCGEGTIWDTSLNTCNHAANVKNQKCGTVSKPETASAENNTESTTRPTEQIDTSTVSSSTQTSLSSTEGEKVTTSSSTTETSTLSSSTVEPTEVTEISITTTSELITSSTPETEHVPSITEISEPVTSTSSTTTQSLTSQSTPPPTQQTGNTCTEEGFFPNLQDCNKYYRCVSNGKGFTKYDFNCGPGTIWDPNLTTCNYPYAVTNKKCGETQQTTTKPNKPTERPNENTDKPHTETSTTGGQTEMAQDKCTADGFFPNSKNCNKFYRCVGNGNGYSKYDFTCGEGTIFDPNIQTCNYPHATENRACGHTLDSKPTTDKDIRTDETPTDATTILETTTYKETTTSEYIDSTTDAAIETTTDIDMQSTTPAAITENTQTTTELDLQTTTDSNLETTTSIDIQSTTDQEIELQSTTFAATTENVQATTDSDLQTTETTTVLDIQSTETTTALDIESTTNQETTISDIGTTEMETKTTTELDGTTIETRTDQTITTESQTEMSTQENQDITTTSYDITTDSTEQATESTTNPIDESTTVESSTQPITNQTTCPISELEGDQISLVCPTGFKRHPKYCNLFYQCMSNPSTMEIKILVLSCPSGTIYDDQKIQCVAPTETTQTCMGQIKEQAQLRNFAPSSLMPMEINQRTPLCPNEGSYPLDPIQCLNTFIKCTTKESRKMRAYIHQCPPHYTYWPISKRCERESPALGCDNNVEVNNERFKWIIPVEVQNIARN